MSITIILATKFNVISREGLLYGDLNIPAVLLHCEGVKQ